MTKTEVLAHFGGQTAVAKALGMSQPSVSAWPEQLPVLRQLEIERLTLGVLKAGPECAKYRVPAETKAARATRLVVRV